MFDSAQTVELPGTVTAGKGLTVMVKLTGVPVQLLLIGVTVMVAVRGDVVVLLAIKAGTFPDPLATSPMAGLEFVQE